MGFKLTAEDLGGEAARERALDRLGEWFVEAVVGAGQDGEAVGVVMEAAVVAFYDIRESADQPRNEYAGHFFMVDAVGLDNTDRPIPWDALAQRVGRDALEWYGAIFDAAELRAR